MTKISNQYSLTNILTADLANSRLGINNVSPTVALDVTGAGKFSGALTGTTASFSSNVTAIDYINVKKDGSDTAFSGAYLSVSNAANNVSWGWQLGASNKLSLWLYNGGPTSNPLTITSSGNVVINPSGTSSLAASQFVNKQKSDSVTPYLNGIVNMSASTSSYLGMYYDGSTHIITATYYTGGDGGAYKPIAFQTSDVERMRITAAGNVGIGTTTPSARLHTEIAVESPATGAVALIAKTSNGANDIFRWFDGATQLGVFKNSGNVGIGTSSPTDSIIGAGTFLDIASTGGGALKLHYTNATAVGEFSFYKGSNGSYIDSAGAATLANNDMIFRTGGTASNYGVSERMRITSAGNVNINGSGFSDVKFYVKGSDATSSNYAALFVNGSGTNLFNIRNDGAVTVFGSLSKGSGSFRIDHPLKPETHQLVHSFIEGPQADLIYRGKLTLVNGKAQANIDEVSTMTEGTFKALCREVQCFTTNENGWDLVKGKVIGNIIYIESQNPNSTDEISWMVIGERKDKHMMDTEWTDEQGKVIVEPLKQK